MLFPNGGGMRAFLCLSLGLLPQAVQAASVIRYGEIPEWAQDPPVRSGSPASEGAVDVRFNDAQVRITDTGTSNFTRYRIKLLRPEALTLGNINVAWNPQTTNVIVNRLIVHREGQAIDVLKDQTFRIFQREGRLEQAMLDGLLTANLQIPGLRIGDEIEFAFTMNMHDPIFGNAVFGGLGFPGQLAPGVYRLSLSWLDGKSPRWRATPDVQPILKERPSGLVATFEDAGKLSIPSDAPPRYSIGRTIQFSTFRGWDDMSQKTFDLYKSAAELPKDPDLDARLKKIEQEEDPRARAVKALELVQSTVRYVFTGMNGGNYIPAPANLTWDRRFGDCKGQTALLMAILRRLGIDAEPVLVSVSGGDGLDAQLPSPLLFDHILLRTTIDGRRYWLDGTRTGDHHLQTDDEVPYRWVLPLSAKGEQLAQIAYQPPKQPKSIEIIDIDATAGTSKPAKVSFTRVLRGDESLVFNLQLKSQTAEGARQSLMKIFEGGWITPEDVSWTHDETSGATAVKVSGTTELDWDSDEDGPNTELPGGGFYPPDRRARPSGQDLNAPYANTPGKFSCSVTRMRLPKLPKGHWESRAKKIDMVVGGIAYYRQVNLMGDTIRLIRSSRTQLAEISSTEAAVANGLIPKFDNSKVAVWTYKGSKAVSEISDPKMPEFDAVDWLRDGSQCLPERDR